MIAFRWALRLASGHVTRTRNRNGNISLGGALFTQGKGRRCFPSADLLSPTSSRLVVAHEVRAHTLLRTPLNLQPGHNRRRGTRNCCLVASDQTRAGMGRHNLSRASTTAIFGLGGRRERPRFFVTRGPMLSWPSTWKHRSVDGIIYAGTCLLPGAY